MFEIYKKGQGITARWLAAGILLALGVFGCFSLQDWLSGDAWARRSINLAVISIRVSVLVSAGAFLVLACVAGLVVNHKRLVDYLINSEAELRKVSWPTRPELKRQTIVVIISMMFFGAFLWIADLFFGYLSRQVYGF